MRTHLLHVVPVLAPDSDNDNGLAANDGTYSVAALVARRMLVPAITPDALKPQQGQGSCGSNDEYWLGGYAGI